MQNGYVSFKEEKSVVLSFKKKKLEKLMFSVFKKNPLKSMFCGLSFLECFS